MKRACMYNMKQMKIGHALLHMALDEKNIHI